MYKRDPHLPDADAKSCFSCQCTFRTHLTISKENPRYERILILHEEFPDWLLFLFSPSLLLSFCVYASPLVFLWDS